MDQTVRKSVLANGVRILTQKLSHVRSVSLGIWVDVGARDESLEENGLSHFIEHMLFKGTDKRSAFDIAKDFDAIGGQNNAFTTMENTCFHAKVMDTHLTTMVEILSDIFLGSRFRQEDLDNERPVILAEIDMVEDSPEEYAHLLLESNFWGSDSLGRSILGSRENIEGFTAKDLKRFYKKHYRPERIIISAAGNVDHDDLVALLSDNFGAIPPGDATPQRISPPQHAPLSLCTREIEQVHLAMGVRGLSVSDPRRYAGVLMNTILGGNMSSRLFQHIRENRGLAYSVYSFSASNVTSGMLGVYAATAPSNVEQSIELILKDMTTLKDNPVSPSELSDVSQYIKGNMLLSNESTDSLMERIALNELHFGREISMEEVLEGVDNVTADDIMGLAGELFFSGRPALTVLGPLSDPGPIEKILNR